MPQTIRFFPRQVVAGNDAGVANIYSEIFDVERYAEIEIQAWTLTNNSGTAVISGILQSSCDASFDTWGEPGQVVITGVNKATLTLSKPLRFVRAKLQIPTGTYAMICVEGVAREST